MKEFLNVELKSVKLATNSQILITFALILKLDAIDLVIPFSLTRKEDFHILPSYIAVSYHQCLELWIGPPTDLKRVTVVYMPSH